MQIEKKEIIVILQEERMCYVGFEIYVIAICSLVFEKGFLIPRVILSSNVFRQRKAVPRSQYTIADINSRYVWKLPLRGVREDSGRLLTIA